MTNKKSISVVWLKRDLRLTDHAPLFHAMQLKKPILVFYCFEPSLRCYYDWDIRHWRFILQSLRNLKQKISLHWYSREVIDVLNEVKTFYHIDVIFSHQETGIAQTYDRDKEVSKWCRENHILWKEFQHGGVVRALRNREQWPKLWAQYMNSSQLHPDLSQCCFLTEFPALSFLAHGDDTLIKDLEDHKDLQRGGEAQAQHVLEDFFQNRIYAYLANISLPAKGR